MSVPSSSGGSGRFAGGSPAGAAVTALGELLRSAREARGLCIAEVAGTTRVREHWLRGIEAGELSALPEDVFVRGFVRAFARAVGVDAEHANRLLSALLRERSRAKETAHELALSSLGAAVASLAGRPASEPRVDPRDDEETLAVAPLAAPDPTAVPEPAYREARVRAGVALAVVVLLIAATVAVSMLLRRPVPPADSISWAPPAALAIDLDDTRA